MQRHATRIQRCYSGGSGYYAVFECVLDYMAQQGRFACARIAGKEKVTVRAVDKVQHIFFCVHGELFQADNNYIGLSAADIKCSLPEKTE